MRGTSTSRFAGITVIAIALVALIYWPVVHANFVWDDWLDFHDRAWLSHGEEWKHFVFRGFNDWTNYFRPLGVALFTAQVRLFDGLPGPMHAVSLGLHLINTSLVGVLSWRFAISAVNEMKRACFLAASMLLYGLHPVLIEPVAWIGCQFDLTVTMLTLLGLIANLSIKGLATRAAVVAFLFFLAACAKESAISFPLVLLVLDWLLLPRHADEKTGVALCRLIRRNWQVYAGIVIAGMAYLGFRHWAIGAIINPFAGNGTSAIGRVQEVCFLYLHYWKTLLWPMSGLSPIHPMDTAQFSVITLWSVLVDAAAIGLFVCAFFSALVRSSPIGCIVLAVTVSLFPVLHIASAQFDSSAYHERYAMNALAAICVMLPLARFPGINLANRSKLVTSLLGAIIIFWLAFAVMNIRATLPLWSNNVNLWRWALLENPDSVEAKDSLLSAYINAGDYADAHALIDRLLIDHTPCPNCLLNAASMAIAENDPASAARALEEVKNSKMLSRDRQMFGMYLLTTGQMLVLQGHFSDAEEVLKAAIAQDPLNPQSTLSLAMAFALQGNAAKARKTGETGLNLLPSDERDPRRKALSDAIAQGLLRTQPGK